MPADAPLRDAPSRAPEAMSVTTAPSHEPAAMPVTNAPSRAPFAMIAGDPAAMVCEGDVCFVPDGP
jgi:hypothetical protein